MITRIGSSARISSYVCCITALAGAACLAWQLTAISQAEDAKESPLGPRIEIERLTETEAVLKEIRHPAWVFKYRGGKLDCDFAIHHRPAGADQKETVVHHVDNETIQKSVPSPQEALKKALGIKAVAAADGGYLIVSMPQSAVEHLKIVDFSLSVGGSRISSSEAAEKVLPKSVFAANAYTLVEHIAAPSKTNAASGEMKVLLDVQMLLGDGPRDEREAIRYVLSVTPIEDGELSNRGDE